MPGFGVHTFRLLNKAGKETFVKFHWIPKQGAESCIAVIHLLLNAEDLSQSEINLS